MRAVGLLSSWTWQIQFCLVARIQSCIYGIFIPFLLKKKILVEEPVCTGKEVRVVYLMVISKSINLISELGTI